MANENDKLTSIHTLENDLATAVRDDNYGKNIIKVVTNHDQQLKIKSIKDEDVKSSNKFSLNIKSISIILITVFFIGLIIASYFIYNTYTKTSNENTATTDIVATTTVNKPIIKDQNILNTEIIQNIDFSKLNRDGIVDSLNEAKILLNNNNITPGNNVSINTNVTFDDFLSKIRYSGEESLNRSVDTTNYVLGLYSVKDKNFENYILIKVKDFDLSFKSMLSWEKYMPIDLRGIFIGNNQISTSTESDTGVFLDKTLKNYDIRKYVKNSDNSTIIYGFINNKYILITSGEASFIDIKDRLLKESISR